MEPAAYSPRPCSAPSPIYAISVGVETEVGRRVLALEQMLTSGGGWQDQFGGIHRGLKLLQTKPGLEQTPEIRWLPEQILTDHQNASCCLLYYTGVARSILADIVRGMFLNKKEVLGNLDTIIQHAIHTARIAPKGSYSQLTEARFVDLSVSQTGLSITCS